MGLQLSVIKDKWDRKAHDWIVNQDLKLDIKYIELYQQREYGSNVAALETEIQRLADQIAEKNGTV